MLRSETDVVKEVLVVLSWHCLGDPFWEVLLTSTEYWFMNQVVGET